jgi:hypothetical protein
MLGFAQAGSHQGLTTEGQKQGQQDQERRLKSPAARQLIEEKRLSKRYV